MRQMETGDVYNLKHKEYPGWKFRLSRHAEGWLLFVREPLKFRCVYEVYAFSKLTGTASILECSHILMVDYHLFTVISKGQVYS